MNPQTIVKHHIEVPSNQEGLTQLEEYVQAVLDQLDVDSAHHGNVLVAVSEAANNAAKHGNKDNPSLNVSLSYKVEGRELLFFIKDCGSGFDYNNIPDPTAPENIEKESGRGVFLIKNLSDGYEFMENGSLLKISFFIL